MRKNYHIKLNPEKLSGEDIDKHKDFDALLKQYQQSGPSRRPGRRLRLFYIGIAVAAAVAGVLFFFQVLNQPAVETPALTNEAYLAQQEFVRPPLEQIRPAFTEHRVDAEEGGTYDFASGSRLVIPSKAFMDDRGRLVTGDVDIHYREMHDYVDFFLSGIPMVYDSAGQQYYLESAGMIEVFALYKGERVNLAPGKTIEVELVSEILLPNVNVSPRYNVYKLDTLQRKWVFQDAANLRFLDEQALDEDDPLYWPKRRLLDQTGTIEARAAAERARLVDSIAMPSPPVKPQPLRNNQPSLELTFLDGVEVEGQEFYEGTIWQISTNSPDFDPDMLEKPWEDFKLDKINNLEYELVLTRGDEKQHLTLMPVLSGSDYERALEIYEADYADYLATLAEREAALNQKLALLNDSVQKEKEAVQAQFQTQLDSLSQWGVDTEETAIRRRIVHRFRATSLGIWNCDQPIPVSGKTLHAEFVDQHGNKYDHHTAYLVNQGQNTVHRYYSGEGGLIRLEENSKGLLWVVSKDNKLAVLRPHELKDIDLKEERVLLVLQLIDREIRDEQDVREVLKF
jgi:hypothetical protein